MFMNSGYDELNYALLWYQEMLQNDSNFYELHSKLSDKSKPISYKALVDILQVTDTIPTIEKERIHTIFSM